jgi:CDP-diacylglycerol--serine O-phosphatidyltransferase
MVQALQGQPEPTAQNLVIAGWLILAGMLCDALDGQLARLTRRASDFGAQLDSLCDAITFGVAPAFLMMRAVQGDLAPYVGAMGVTPQAELIGRAIWFIGALYMACAILRLARFNVETKPDVLSHMNFWGLPSPGAALAVASLVLVHEHLKTTYSGWQHSHWLFQTVIWAMPLVTLAAAVLMVTRIRYPHLVNRRLRGRRSFGYIVRLLVVVLAAVVLHIQIALAAAALAYLAWPPIAELGRMLRGKAGPPKTQGGGWRPEAGGAAPEEGKSL